MKKELNMPPNSPVDDVPKVRLSDSEMKANLRLAKPFRELFSDFNHLLLVQLGVVMIRPIRGVIDFILGCVPFFETHVKHVVRLSAEKQMRWVNASRNIAFVQHIHSQRDFPIVDHPRKTMRGETSATRVVRPISLINISFPNPTVVRFLNVYKKTAENIRRGIAFVCEPIKTLASIIHKFVCECYEPFPLQRTAATAFLVFTFGILFQAFPVQAATRITTVITITSAPNANTNNLVYNGADTRTWTGTVATAATQIKTTNNIANSVTNLKTHLDTYKFKSWHSVGYWTNAATQVYILAGTNDPISVAIGGAWATVTYITNIAYSSDFLLLPPNPMQSNSFVIWQMSALATNLQKSTSAIGNVTLTNSFFSGGSIGGAAVTNVSTLSGTIGAVTNGAFNRPMLTNASGTFTNPVITSATLTTVATIDGTLGALTNGALQGTMLTNASGTFTNPVITSAVLQAPMLTNASGTFTNPTITAAVLQAPMLTNASGTFTNITVTDAYITNAVMDRPVLSNAVVNGGTMTGTVFSITGSGLGTWLTIESSSTTAALGPAIFFHRYDGTTNAAESGDVLMHLLGSGYGETALKGATRIKSYANSNFTDGNFPARIEIETTSIGASASTVRVIVDEVTVITNGLFRATGTNMVFSGTNNWDGDISRTAGSYSSLVDRPSANTAVPIATNATVELSGGAAFVDIHSFELRRVGYEFLAIFSGHATNVIVNQSGSEGTVALRITTGTGANVNQTNSPAWARFRKRTGDWLLIERSN